MHAIEAFNKGMRKAIICTTPSDKRVEIPYYVVPLGRAYAYITDRDLYLYTKEQSEYNKRLYRNISEEEYHRMHWTLMGEVLGYPNKAIQSHNKAATFYTYGTSEQKMYNILSVMVEYHSFVFGVDIDNLHAVLVELDEMHQLGLDGVILRYGRKTNSPKPFALKLEGTFTDEELQDVIERIKKDYGNYKPLSECD